MPPDRSDVVYGTLALLILKTLETMGPLHGYALARRIEQISENQLTLNQGTLYPALRRLQQMGWVTGKWGESNTGRKARFYSLTRRGTRQLQTETDNWARTSAIVARFVKDL